METPLTPLEFARRARKLYADREAVVDGSLRRTYQEFFDRARPPGAFQSPAWHHLRRRTTENGHRQNSEIRSARRPTKYLAAMTGAGTKGCGAHLRTAVVSRHG